MRNSGEQQRGQPRSLQMKSVTITSVTEYAGNEIKELLESYFSDSYLEVKEIISLSYFDSDGNGLGGDTLSWEDDVNEAGMWRRVMAAVDDWRPYPSEPAVVLGQELKVGPLDNILLLVYRKDLICYTLEANVVEVPK